MINETENIHIYIYILKPLTREIISPLIKTKKNESWDL